MKSQFIKKPGPGSSPPTSAQAPGAQWLDGAQPDMHVPQLQEPAPLPQAAQMTGNGLGPSWPIVGTPPMPAPSKLFNGPILAERKPRTTIDFSTLAPSHIAEQETTVQPAAPVPNRGPYTAPLGFAPPPQARPWSQSGIAPFLDPAGPVSPHQSHAGINLFAPPATNRPAGMQAGPISQAGIPFVPPTMPVTGPYGPPSQPLAMAPQAPLPLQTRLRKKRRFPIWARVLVAALVLLVALGGSAYTYFQVTYGTAVNNITGVTFRHLKGNEKIEGSTNTTNVSTNGNTLTGERINILLLGSDTDGKKGNDIETGTPLAQTDIVVTIDPQTKYVGMFSIPRDLQVSIPGYTTPGKMDYAFEYGVGAGGSAVKDRVGYGAGLAIDTIAANFGIKINYYAWVDIYGFAKVVDTAGGVDIDITHPTIDNNYPDDANKATANGYKRLYIAPGPQHMNGQQALEYVRTRHAELQQDFARSVKQQQLLTALKQKLNNANIITEAPQLLKDLDGSLFTNLTLDQMLPIANYAHGIDTNKIDRVSLGISTYVTPSGTDTNFLPNCEAIKQKIATMFGIGDQANCIPQTALPAVASNASQSSTTLATIAPPATNVVSSTVTSSTATQAGQGITTDLSGGVHNLLDLMLMGVFQSFDAFKS